MLREVKAERIDICFQVPQLLELLPEVVEIRDVDDELRASDPDVPQHRDIEELLLICLGQARGPTELGQFLKEGLQIVNELVCLDVGLEKLPDRWWLACEVKVNQLELAAFLIEPDYSLRHLRRFLVLFGIFGGPLVCPLRTCFLRSQLASLRLVEALADHVLDELSHPAQLKFSLAGAGRSRGACPLAKGDELLAVSVPSRDV